MSILHLVKGTILLFVLILLQLAATGQVRVSGTIYDRTGRFGMVGVSVMSNSGAGTVTDSAGRYSIRLPLTDSISFSYQGKATMKFPVNEIHPNRPFDMKLHVDIRMLPTVDVSANKLKDYSQDSLEHRNEYRKVFDYAPQLLTGANSGQAGVGINLDMIFNAKKIKRMEAFRELLERDEQEKYVDHRFTKVLVKKITGLESPALDAFMKQYRPSYEMFRYFRNDYEYYLYIRDNGRYFARVWELEHPTVKDPAGLHILPGQ
ncbi:carboxypeptidase regulatory-like domain-containing protein [Chitinophaga sp. HK235]|uniref:carboxypeptidase regulatory-like domain-containing protein n=1 Tax=Chitinophaga sp. HK235 TaxID=2952571 RepID=UPI001BA7CDAE|nr:carboxypeptidase regulatory-like domain-containing protein [Chitinophaga sp. HK235]